MQESLTSYYDDLLQELMVCKDVQNRNEMEELLNERYTQPCELLTMDEIISRNKMRVLIEKIKELRKCKKWKEAAELGMILNEEYPDSSFKIKYSHIHYTTEEKLELETRAKNDKKVAFYVGVLKYYGKGGYIEDIDNSYIRSSISLYK